jgi:curli biogenesis system outer membrane secretion channel CsgG
MTGKSAALLYSMMFFVVGPKCGAQDFHPLASSVSQRISVSGRKSVAVTDFTDLDGNPTKLGRFLAEEFSNSLFSEAKGFDVIDRTHLKTILQEHKLATSGLIDPATARKLGQIAGVETLVTGTLTPFEEYVRLSLKVLDTETAKIIAASTMDVPKTKTISDLIASEHGASNTEGTSTKGSDTSHREAPAVLPQGVTRDELLFLPRGCRDKGGAVACTFGVTNKAEATRRVWFTGAIFVDDQGHQYDQVRLDFGSKTSWLDQVTDLIPGVPVNLVLEIPSTPDSVSVMNAQLSYGVQGYTGQYLAPNVTFGKVSITGVSVTH